MHMKILGAVCTLIALVQLAGAEQIPGSSFVYGNWQGAGYTNDRTGEFSHCAVNAPFVSGDSLFFSVNSQGSVSVGVANPNFSFTPGERFPVSIYVDRRKPFYGTAEAIGEDFAALEIREFDRALTAFKKGFLMRIETPNGYGKYDLSGTFRALEKATQCAYNFYQYASVPATGPNDTIEFDKTVLFQVATEVINELGVSGFRFYSEDELREAGSSVNTVRWISEEYGVEGAAVLVPSEGLNSLKDTDGVDTQYIADSCDGDFATSARQIAYSEADARELRLVCTTGDAIRETYVTKVLVGDAVLYTILTFFIEEYGGQKQDRQEASERAAIRAASYILE